ncbi:MAG: FG-GAP repeat protein [Candidatus Marinimicrobia bacterium]|nr:FG-GAP repeat protein [Candidatus Neomarinimicrobiota bacterium]
MKRIFYIYIALFSLFFSTSIHSKNSFDLKKVATISGYTPDDGFGLPIKDVGDVNNDGYPDLAIGYGRYPDCPDTSRENCHRIDIYYGGDTLDIIPDITFWDILNIWGNVDLNGDGYIDLVARDYYNSSYGQVKIYFGGLNGPDTEPDMILSGDWIDGYFGKVVASGDLNADGFDDLIISAPNDYYAAYGRVYVYLGGDPMDDEPDWFYQSTEEFAFYGQTVVCGDMNADGYDDFIVGAPFEFSDDTSMIYIYSGGNSLSTKEVYIYEAPNLTSYLGRKMIYIDNWNNSEFGIVLIGWIRTDDFNEGILKINGNSNFDSLDAEILYNIYNPYDQYYFYGFLQGYINDDYEKDIAIGANQEDLYIYFGQNDFTYPDSILYNKNIGLITTIDLNNDGIDEVIGAHSVLADSTGSKYMKYIDIYSCKPFPVYSSKVNRNHNFNQLDNFTLLTNYPNPFNNSTNIQFYIHQKSQIKISIYDLLGRQIELIEESTYFSGTYTIVWDATGFSSGIYFIKMNIDNGKEIHLKKIMLLQ